MEKDLRIALNKTWPEGSHADWDSWVDHFSDALASVLSQTLSLEIQILNGQKAGDSDFSILFGTDSESFSAPSQESGKKVRSVLLGPLSDKQAVDLAGYGRPYEFFMSSEHEGPTTLQPRDLGQSGKFFWLKIIDLAFEIAREVRESGSSAPLKVFLGEVNPTDKIFREEVRRDLLRRNIEVLPSRPLPRDEAACKKIIEEDLKDSDLFIQILGNQYGPKVGDSGVSYPEFQFKAVSEYCDKQKDPMRRILWLSPDENIRDLNQNEFIDRLIREHSGSEFVQIPLEYLKSLIRREITARVNKRSGVKGDQDDWKPLPDGTAYLLHDKGDLKWANELEKTLEKSGIKVQPSQYLEQPSKALNFHKNCLANCDTVILLADKASPQWLISKMKDILKSPGFGRNRDFQKKMLVSSDTHKQLAEKAKKEGYEVIAKGVGQEADSLKKMIQS